MHHTYIIPGVVDGSVAHAQAQKRKFDKRHPESTVVHDHKYGSPCNDKCVTYQREEE